MELSIFTNKSTIPSDNDLSGVLIETAVLWFGFKEFAFQFYPNTSEEWNYSKYGWSFRLKDKKRAIFYLLPRNKYFKIAFVFGQKAYHAIMESDISNEIKIDLQSAKVYAEGRGIRIDITDNSKNEDIFKLIKIKMKY